MANVFASLPVPAADGVGAWVDVSGIGPEKTVSVDGGVFGGSILLEASNDAQASAAPAAVGPFPGPTFVPQTFVQALQFMRVRRMGSNGVGTPTVSIAGPAASASVFGAMNVPTSDGVGTAIDLSGGGDVNTFQVEGPFSGQILIETSTDGVNFSPTLLFSVFHGVGQTVQGVLSAARVRRRGTTSAALPLISVGSGATQGGGGGGFPGFGGAPPAVAIASAAGGAGTASRSDHTHAAVVLNIAAGAGITAANVGGTWTIAATAVSFPGFGGAPPGVTTAGSSAGAAGTVSRSDHTHAGVLSIVAGTNVTIADDGAGNVTVNASGGGGGFPGYGGAPPAVAAASAAGAALTVSRSDHTHAGVVSVTASTGMQNTGTASAPVLTVNLSTGFAGGQSAVGGTLTTQNLTLRPNAADTTTGQVIGQGAGFVAPNGTVGVPGYSFVSGVGWVGFASNVQLSIGGGAVLFLANGVVNELSDVADTGFLVGSAGTTGVTYDGANGLRLKANNVTRVTVSSAGVTTMVGTGGTAQNFTFAPNTPFVGWGATTAAANTSTVMRFALNPPAVASGAGHALDAYVFDPVTVQVTGTSGIGLSLVHIKSPTYNQTGASTVSVATTVEIDPPNKTGSGAPWLMSAALYINDPNATGNANLIVNDIVYTPTIIGASGLGDQNLQIMVVGSDTLQFLSGVALDGSGGQIEGTMNSGAWSLGRNGVVTIQPSGTDCDVFVGYPSLLAVGATHGFPYMPIVNGIPTGAPNAFGGPGAPFAFDGNDHLLFIRNITGAQWEACPTFNSTAPAGAQVAAAFTNVPTAVVSTTWKYWTFKTPAGTQTYIPYLQ